MAPKSSAAGSRSSSNKSATIFKFLYYGEMFSFQFDMQTSTVLELYNIVASKLGKDVSTFKVVYDHGEARDVWLKTTDNFRLCEPSSVTPEGVPCYHFSVDDI